MRRVAITGAGVVSPIGKGWTQFAHALGSARSGIALLPPEIARDSGVQVGALVDWGPPADIKATEAASLDRVSQFALAVATEALASSRLDGASAERSRIGVYWGTGMGGACSLEAAYKQVMPRTNGVCARSPW